MRIYSNDGYMSISVDQEECLLYYKISGYPKFSEIIRNGHDKILVCVKEMKSEKPINYLVADLLDAKILLNEDLEFIAKVSYPRLANEGIKHLVILVSENINVKINVEKTLEYLDPKVFESVKLIENKKSIQKWLKSLA